MASIICAQCGAVFEDRDSFRRHYVDTHPDQPFVNAYDTPVEDEGGRSWGGSEPTDAGRPLNVFEEVMEETPEDTAEDLERDEEQTG